MRGAIASDSTNGSGSSNSFARILDEFLSFLMSLQATGAILSLIILFTFGIQTGGPAVMVWGWLGATILAAIVVSNLAEIASAYPRTPGSAYFWAGQLCPRDSYVLVSYWTGVFIVVAYTGYAASYAYGFAVLIDAAMSYSGLGALIELEEVSIAFAALAVWAFLSYLRIDYADWIAHISAFLQISVALVIIMVVTISAKKYNTAKYVFSTVQKSEHGFPQINFVLAISVISQFYPFSEFSAKKGAIHLFDEEAHPVTEFVSASMGLMNTGIVTGLLGFGLLLALLFTMENEASSLAAENGVLEILQHTAGEVTTMVLGWYIVVAAFMVGLSFTPAAIKLIHALSKDGFFPYSAFFEKLDERTYAANATLLFFFLAAMILALDVVEDLDGNGQIFYSILQTTNFAFQVSFGTPILLKITRPCPFAIEAIKNSHFYLGNWSFVMGCVAVFFLFSTAVMLNIPTMYPVTGESMNYTSVVVAVLVLLGWLNWEFNAKYTFKGPKRTDDDIDHQYYAPLPGGDDDTSELPDRWQTF